MARRFRTIEEDGCGCHNRPAVGAFRGQVIDTSAAPPIIALWQTFPGSNPIPPCWPSNNYLREFLSMTTAAEIGLQESAIAGICRLCQVKELSLFGSAARGEMGPDSDYDLLVDFLPGARPGLIGVSALTRELTNLLGRPVDLAVEPALKPLIRSSVLAEARLIYAA